MQFVAVIQLLVLLAAANGVPVIAKKIMGAHFAWPLDGGMRFADGRPVLGASKTIRGIVLAIVTTAGAAPLVGLSPMIGAMVGATAMTGDLISSFTKRRLGLTPSSRSSGLDQIPEALLPALACRFALALELWQIGAVVAIFFVGEVVLSRLMYRAHLRDEPY